MFKRGLYHFPVLLSSQGVQKDSKDATNKLIEANTCLVEAGDTYYSKEFLLKLNPLAMNLEDTFFYKIQEYMNMLLQSDDDIGSYENPTNSNELILPPSVIFATESASQMVYLNKIVIEAIDLQVSAHASVKVFVGLEDSKINLSRFENQAVWSTWYSLGHRLSMHYLSGALFKAGWVVGSLDMIGSPAAFTRTVTDGVKDFVSLPYNGIWNGPWGFLVGISQGSSSLVKHVSAGSLTSITNFASSMSRNLDRLSFDNEHLIRNEEVRRLRPQGLGEGLINGLSGVGISLLGAIGGLAHHPIQVLLEHGVSPVKLIGGVGRGMVGVVTKPLGSAAELIAQTGHGMLTGSGWSRTRRPRLSSVPSLVFDMSSSQLKYQWKVLFGEAACVVDASLFEENQYIAVSVVLSKNAVHIISEDEDETKNVYNIDEVNLVEASTDPTLLVLELKRSDIHEKYQHVNDRVARFVLESISFAEQGLDPQLQPPSFSDSTTSKVLLYMSPHTRKEFCTIFYQLKAENQKIGFPVLF